MAVTTDIVAFWRRPRETFRGKLAQGPREDRALAVLMASCVLVFIAEWPALSRAATLDPSIPLDARLGGALMGTLFVLPLLAYALAALSHLVARALGGRASGFGARLALFWALLAASPLVLLTGLLAGIVGAGLGPSLFGIAAFAAFLWLWLTLLSEAGRWT